MSLERFSVCWAEFEWRNCKDERPSVIISPSWYVEDPRSEELLVALVSGAMDLYDPERHFLLSDSDPMFASTGLKRRSFVALDHITFILRRELKRPVGTVEGALQTRLLHAIRTFLEL